MNKVQEMLVQMLKGIDFLDGMSNEQILELSNAFQLKCIESNTTLIKEGIIPDKIYILKNGKLEVEKNSGFGKEKLAEIKPGELFGEFSFFQQKAAVASVRSTDQSVDIWEVSKDSFKTFIDKYPEVQDKIKETMEKRIAENKEKWGDNYENDYYYAGITGEEVSVEPNFELNL